MLQIMKWFLTLARSIHFSKKKNSRLDTQKKNVDVEFVIKESQDKAKTDMDKSST